MMGSKGVWSSHVYSKLNLVERVVSTTFEGSHNEFKMRGGINHQLCCLTVSWVIT